VNYDSFTYPSCIVGITGFTTMPSFKRVSSSDQKSYFTAKIAPIFPQMVPPQYASVFPRKEPLQYRHY
jgi:hypothetical protein